MLQSSSTDRCYLTLLVALFCVLNTGTVQAMSCSKHPNCVTGLIEDPIPEAGFETYTSVTSSDHFVLFTDPVDGMTSSQMSFIEDQLECGFRAFVCTLGLSFTMPNKVHAYVGSSSSGSRSSISINKNAYGSTSLTYKAYVVPSHEFFHYLQHNSYEYFSYDNVMEALAVYAEQIISKTHFDYSVNDYLRMSSLQSTSWFTGYEVNLFYRYLFERYKGYPSSAAERDQFNRAPESWGASIFKKFLEFTTAGGYSASSSPSTLIGDFITFYNAYLVSKGQSIVGKPVSAEDIEGDFITTQYAYRYTSEFVHPEYSLIHKNQLQSVYPWTFYSENLPIRNSVATTLNNTSTVYSRSSTATPGFLYYLNGEYHELDISAGLTNLDLSVVSGDSDLRYQLILRYNDGSIIPVTAPRGLTTYSFSLPNLPNVAEAVFVVYTVNANPQTTESGRLFDIQLTGKVSTSSGHSEPTTSPADPIERSTIPHL